MTNPRWDTEEYATSFLMSRWTIDTSAPVEWTPSEPQPPDPEALREIYKELEFTSLLKEHGAIVVMQNGLGAEEEVAAFAARGGRAVGGAPARPGRRRRRKRKNYT